MTPTRAGGRIVRLALAAVATAAFLSVVPAPAEAGTVRCTPANRPFGYAASRPDHNWVGSRSYYLTVTSKLYRCGGYVLAVHTVHLDGRWLNLGTKIHIRVSTKRGDGQWVGADRTLTSSKNYSDETYRQLRGVGGGLRLTDVHVKHFAEPGQTSVFPASTARARYGPWNGPEAKPRT